MAGISDFLSSKPSLGKDVFVARTAFVVGRIEIGDGSSIWPGVSARADVNTMRIGRRSNIQDNTVLHVDTDAPLVVGNDVTVGHACILHGCTIEDRCLIGMGSVILNGAVVGHDSIVGAGSVVKQGEVVPPRTLWLGVPAKQRRELTEAEVAAIVESARHYAGFALEYLKANL
jgi:carbonic anhydrase/acetyltransferase-like protein (isoleucine patch superfamily)